MQFQENQHPLAGARQTVHSLFEAAAATFAKQTAVVHNGQHLSYQELNERATALSDVLGQRCAGEKIVGVSTTRSIETIVAVIAILKSGRAYLPLDPSFPQERLKQLIDDSGISSCIAPAAEEGFAGLPLQHINTIDTVNDIATVAAAGSLAYVLYTSGSTGKPKGVCMGDAAMVNLLQWQQKDSKADATWATLQFAPLTFDVSFQEVFATLSTGGTLVLIDEATRQEPIALLKLVEKYKVNRLFLPFVALQYITEAASASGSYPACLREVITAGEQLKITPAVADFFTHLPGCSLTNQYGPTESHVVTSNTLTGPTDSWEKLPGIGKAIDNTTIIIADENGRQVANGITGELCISGLCLADGYLNNETLTKAKFTDIKLVDGTLKHVYLSGDLASIDEQGNVTFSGRKDAQVKINGIRVEPGEIEVVLNAFSGIQQAVVTVKEDKAGSKKLVAYLVPASGYEDTNAVKTYLRSALPDYMVPAHFMWLRELPKTTSGKVDRRALPAPTMSRAELSEPFVAAQSQVQRHIVSVFEAIFETEPVGIRDNFFDLGGSSVTAIRAATMLQARYGYQVAVTKLYQCPTVEKLAAFIGNKTEPMPLAQPAAARSNEPVAVIGMSIRFPGANTLDELWSMLSEGREGIRFFNDEELSPFVSKSLVNDTGYVKARGTIDGVDTFDAAFFGISPKAAALMDPQQRIFLELAWETLEATGHLPSVYNGKVGVYAGCGNNTYYINNVLPNETLVNNIGAFNVMTLNEKDYIASRTAYELDLKGPAVSVYSACSTSLLAVAQAVEAIRAGLCTVALAGGATVTAPVNSGHLYQEGGMLSKDGHCRPFDNHASGTVFSDGAGAVLLKKLSEAIKDGDKIYGIIKGIGLSNDGAGKASFTAPDAAGQAAAIRMAMDDAGVQPEDISYIEAHGTATPVGDPIEIEGLTMAFGGTAKKQFCAIGSIKSNIGHLTPASGVAGLIKTMLCLDRQQLAPTLFFTAANPNIDFANSPFFVNNQLVKWTHERKVAGVSSFGVGGTNVHVVVEAFRQDQPVPATSRPVQVITWSAKTEESADEYAARLLGLRDNHTLPALPDLAYTLNTTRQPFKYRNFTLATDEGEFLKSLQGEGSQAIERSVLQSTPSETVFMFPGQGSQYVNMGKDLYDHEPVYRSAIDHCAGILVPLLNRDIREVLFGTVTEPPEAAEIYNTLYAQSCIFVTEYALSQLWISWGVQPSILCGHSIGELVAVHLAGVFSLESALKIIASRSVMIAKLPRGKMLSVRADVDTLKAMLTKTLSIAAINGEKLIVVAGPEADITELSVTLTAKEITNQVLLTSHAFHSSMLDPIVEDFRKVMEQTSLSRPQLPVMSTVTGKWLTDAEATSPQYWCNHLRDTVMFADAIRSLMDLDNPLFLEVGPGNVTASLARQQVKGRKFNIIASFENRRLYNEYTLILKALGKVWLQGLPVNWQSFYQHEQRQKVLLPTYCFNKKRCWVDPPLIRSASQPLATAAAPVSPDPFTTIPNANPPQRHPGMRKQELIENLKQLIEEASGIQINAADTAVTFLELGLDSLLLTQLAINFKKAFRLPVSFRQLQEDNNSIELLAEYLDAKLPQDQFQPAATPATPAAINSNPALAAITQQLQLLAQQVAMMQGQPGKPATMAAPTPVANASLLLSTEGLSAEEVKEIKKPFGASPRIEKKAAALTDKQKKLLDKLIVAYNRKTKGSKHFTQANRPHMADPRAVTGFSPVTKEMIYPIVVNKSKGSRIWDVDGNEYIDALNGFGSNMFGYQPDFLKQAMYDQIEKGYELGPQHELVGEVSKMICEFTGLDRTAFCNTGSEAVLGAMRIARTVTGRSLIVAFTGSYHGISDEVLVRGTKKLKTFPAAAGIMPEAVQNMLILDYGSDETLDIIRQRGDEIAAVLVEPVQSRRPEFVPVEFLKKLRSITRQSGTVLVFDEVITGFRMHPGGTQAMFGIKADLATYGKVIGGGLPIGVIAGSSTYMDALDGGYWQYGDQSFPEVGVTYFAGTFVRHPLALATARATLQYLKAKGGELQKQLNENTGYLAGMLNYEMEKRGLPMYVANFGSLWKIKFKEEVTAYELMFLLMRHKGIHIWDGFPCFITEAHTRHDLDAIVKAFTESIDEMIEAGFYGEAEKVHHTEKGPQTEKVFAGTFDKAQFPNARLGRDKEGNPAWFVADPEQPGKYLQIRM